MPRSTSSGGARCCRPSRATRSRSCSRRSERRTASASSLDDVVVSATGPGAAGRPRRAVAAVRGMGPAGSDRRRRCADSRPRASRRLPSCSSVTTIVSDVGGRRRSPVRGIDPDAGVHTVRVTAPSALDSGTWEAAVALGQRALAHQILGAQPRDARPRVHPRARAGAVRPADRALPSRTPPARRHARRGRGPRRHGGSGRRRAEPDHRPRWPRQQRDAPRAPSRATASRCSRASASPPSTRSIGT